MSMCVAGKSIAGMYRSVLQRAGEGVKGGPTTHAVPVQRALQTQPLQQPALRRDGATVGPRRAVAELSRLPTVLAAENARLCGTPLSGCYRALDTLAHLHRYHVVEVKLRIWHSRVEYSCLESDGDWRDGRRGARAGLSRPRDSCQMTAKNNSGIVRPRQGYLRVRWPRLCFLLRFCLAW
jgi:hypothetical protein